jgi:DNA polymerase III alpha subunit
LNNTQLSNRKLWYDGHSSYNPSSIISLLTKNIQVDWVDYITPDILEYNKLAEPNQQIQQKTSCDNLSHDWNIPTEYTQLNVAEYVADVHHRMYGSSVDIDQREIRLAMELSIYYQQGLVDVLRTIIYVINTLSLSDEVWGVGRGSSVSSYVLYVIGAHDVDSFEYELDINDFLHN